MPAITEIKNSFQAADADPFQFMFVFPGLVDSTNALCYMLKPLNWTFVTSWTAAPRTQASSASGV